MTIRASGVAFEGRIKILEGFSERERVILEVAVVVGSEGESAVFVDLVLAISRRLRCSNS